MEDSKRTLKTLLLGIIVYAVPFLILGFFLPEGKIPYYSGLLLGCCAAAGLAVHLYRSLEYCLELDPESAEKKMRMKAAMRFLIMLAVVAAAFYYPAIFNPLGLFAGLMGLKISAYLQPVIHRWYP